MLKVVVTKCIIKELQILDIVHVIGILISKANMLLDRCFTAILVVYYMYILQKK